MGEEEVKLFGLRRSAYSCRVEIALKLKRVQYEFIEEDLSNKSPMLLKYNTVHKNIPVLVNNDKPITEFLVILEYIDDNWKGVHILPEDPFERAMARFWSKFIDEKCMPALLRAAEKGIEEVVELLKILENELKGNKFFGGESIGIVDIAAIGIGYWLGVLEEITGTEVLTKEKFPKLREWIDEFLSCSVVKESLPPRDHLLDIFRARLLAATSASK